MFNLKQFKLNFASKWKVIFWLTLALLLVFTFTPRGYAQALEGAQEVPPQILPAAETQPTETQSGEQKSAVQNPVLMEEPPATFPYKKKFIISSYYSPIPGQSRYFTGSFEGDVRLNGEGVTAADGTKVYPGIAAAPKNFTFGTKIFIPGFGTVAVHDRGGAIKNSRLDIWVGFGEEGLRRAIAWGMRTVEATIYGIDANIKEAVDLESMPLADITWIMSKTEYFKSDLSLGDQGESIRSLQRTLKQLGYFDLEITGYFGEETQSAVKKFQLAEKVVDSEADTGVGNFGPKTRIALEKKLSGLRYQELNDLPDGTLSLGAEGSAVNKLQTLLKRYAYLDGVSGKFDQKTFDSLVRFQTDFAVIESPTSFGAGIYGPRTKASFRELIENNYTPTQSLSKITLDEQKTDGIFTKELAFSDRGEDVYLLQEEMKSLNFLRLEPTGYFGKNTEHAVFKFQQAFGVVSKPTDQGAGVLGPKTISKLNEIALARSDRKNLIAKNTEQKKLLASRLNDEKKLVYGANEMNQTFASDITYGTRNNEVERLQKILKKLGFFKGKLTTAYFGDITKVSLMTFQKNHGLEESGILDLKTRRILNTIISPSQPS